MESLVATLQAFIKDLVQDPQSGLSPEMLSTLEANKAEFNRDFFRTSIDSPQIKPLIQKILQSLDVPALQWGRYIDVPLNVSDFLVELDKTYEKENEKLKQLVAYIEERLSARRRRMVGIAVLVLIAANSLVPTLLLKGGFSLLEQLLAQAIFLPIVGVVFSAGVFIYSLYQNMRDKQMSLWQRIQDNFFIVANAALKVAGYSVLITAATTMTPIAAILLVVAEAVNIFRETANIIRTIVEDKKVAPVNEQDDLSVHQRRVRHDVDFMRRKNDLYIKIGTAILITGVIAAWSFIPGSIFISVAAVVAIGVVYLTAFLLQKQNDRVMKARTQNKLSEIEQKYTEKESAKQKPVIENAHEHDTEQHSTPSPSALPNQGMVSSAKPSNPVPLPSPPAQDTQCFASSHPSQGGMFSVSTNRWVRPKPEFRKDDEDTYKPK